MATSNTAGAASAFAATQFESRGRDVDPTTHAGFLQTWNDFFHKPEIPYGLACTRILLSASMLGLIWPRWLVSRELYSAEGATAQLSVGYGYGSMLPEFSGNVAVALTTLLVVALCSSLVGFMTRASTILSMVLYTYLTLLDSVSSLAKFSVISTHAMLLLSFSSCGAVWSVDAWLARRRAAASPHVVPLIRSQHDLPRSAAWPRRLVQLLIGIVYFGAAITKTQTQGFLSGDQLQSWMLTHINMRHPLGEVLAMYPIVIILGCYVAMIWEVLFVFLVWHRGWRSLMLGLGIAFHLMTCLTLGLIIFPSTCYALYFSFVDETDIGRTAAWYRRRVRGHGWLAQFDRARKQVLAFIERPAWPTLPAWAPAAVYASVVPLLVLAGLALEYKLDPYGLRRPEGLIALEPLPKDTVDTMLENATALRPEDMYMFVDTGSWLAGDQLLARQTVFRPGQLLVTNCQLTPPHGDMYLEWHLRDGSNRLVDRQSMVAPRELARTNFQYRIPNSAEPGEYQVVLRTSGRELTRRTITILPASGAALSRTTPAEPQPGLVPNVLPREGNLDPLRAPAQQEPGDVPVASRN